jgi:ArsR family transcriptional regulator, arsenate/arsenite/antimonite-responsive transcriptional repressor
VQLISIKPTELFQALSDPWRLRVVRLLAKTGEEACLCELADSLQTPDYALSRHMKLLRQVGMLSSTRDGRWVYFRVAKGPYQFNDLMAVVCSLPDPDKVFAGDLARFRQFARLRIDGRCRGRAEAPMEKARGMQTRR